MPKKNGWYYAGMDAGGAIGWGATGSFFGPMGMAVGVVIGGAGTSAWNWYWDQPTMIRPSDDEFTHNFNNINEQAGFVHNEFMIEFVNDNIREFANSEEFVEALHKPLVMKLSESFSMPIEEVDSLYNKAKLSYDLNRFSESFDELNEEEYINQIVSVVQENYESDTIPNYFRKILEETAHEKDKEYFNYESYFNRKIKEVRENESISEFDKEIYYNFLNVFKYSYSLWKYNT